MDEIKTTLITRDFNRMLADFSTIDPRIEFSQIVRAVAIRVVAGALRRTKAADAARIRETHESAQYVTLDGKLHNLSYRYPDYVWSRIVSKRRATLDTKLASRGLSKKSWLHQAENLGGTVDVPAYVRNANFKSREYPEDVSSSESGGGGDYALKIINTSPIVQAAGGLAALFSAMQAETRYYAMNLAKGAFKTAARRAAKYPGVFVSPLPVTTV